jgi:hypothetical protein
VHAEAQALSDSAGRNAKAVPGESRTASTYTSGMSEAQKPDAVVGTPAERGKIAIEHTGITEDHSYTTSE